MGRQKLICMYTWNFLVSSTTSNILIWSAYDLRVVNFNTILVSKLLNQLFAISVMFFSHHPSKTWSSSCLIAKGQTLRFSTQKNFRAFELKLLKKGLAVVLVMKYYIVIGLISINKFYKFFFSFNISKGFVK